MQNFIKNHHHRGRFAPSPTGPLHFGSLVAAMGSYLDARSCDGEWLVRIEDLDRTREINGATQLILETLVKFGFCWDGEIIYQSRRTDAYAAAIEKLANRHLAYPCACTRKEITERALTGVEGAIYPGTCRKGLAEGREGRSIRVKTSEGPINISDAIQGPLIQQIDREIGDFIIRRGDGYHAYQLAVVIDDAWQGITHIVRGADLLSSTPRQVFLQKLFGLSHPIYAHLPLAVDNQGRKLSKQHHDAPVDPKQPMDALLQALAFLHQPLPPQRPNSLDEFWRWATAHWSLAAIPAIHQIPASSLRYLNNLR
ncbi:MAG: tRNA glutamyl-Q(34) synthetase GluQRS [Candidatus Thiodiazotropha sp. (ex Ustalcina ferruginea)]|nr:tRNA glutamyl-Q(34) synthetase GluQRS [Candidatus Thiodiazotropha sp. (ex Ustalcina ferruginea)]